jgi:hypothetical protein
MLIDDGSWPTVLFLDFDGVLNFHAMRPQIHACARGGGDACDARTVSANLNRCNVERVNAVISATGAGVVLSTSWRRSFDTHTLAHALEDAGLVGRVIDATPCHNIRSFWLARGLESDRMQRGHEIAAWLLLHPSVARAVILDDDADMWTLSSLLVRTNSFDGMLAADTSRATEIVARSAPVIATLRASYPA